MKKPADKAIADIFDRLGDRGLLPGIDAMCNSHHVTVEDVAGKRRTKSVVRARHAVWSWMHDELGLSWPEVGRLFGRSHDSIMQASDKRDSKARRALEDRVAERIAEWLEREMLNNVEFSILTDGNLTETGRLLGRSRDSIVQAARKIRAGEWRE